jgi:sigma-B regulation protein RsbU (phosphoserine phosphatase)
MALAFDRNQYAIRPALALSQRFVRRARVFIVAITVGLGVVGLIGSGQIFQRAYLGMVHRNLTVTLVTPRGPAEAAGIEAGDRILEVEGVPAEQVVLARLTLRNARAGDVLDLLVAHRDGTRSRIALRGAPPPTSEVVWRFSRGLAGLCALALGFLLAYRRPEKLTLVFFGISLSMAFILCEPPSITSRSWDYLHESFYSFAQYLLAAFFVHFFLVFPATTQRRQRFEKLVYVPAIVLSCGHQILAFAARRGEKVFALESLHLILATIYFIVYIGLAITLFVRSFQRTRSPALRARLRVAVWGTVLGLAPMLITAVLVNLFPSRDFPGARYTVLALVLIPASFAYAAFRHRIFDIEILVKRSVVYTTLTAILLAIYFGLVTGVGALLYRLTGASNPLLVVVSIVAMALIAAPVRTRLQRWVDRVFFRERYDARATLRRFSHDLSRVFAVDEIATLLVHRVSDLLEVEMVSLLLRKREGEPFRLERSIRIDPEGGGPVIAGAERNDRGRSAKGNPVGTESGKAAGSDSRRKQWREISPLADVVLNTQHRPLRLDDPGDALVIEQLVLDDRRALAGYQTRVLVPLHARNRLLGMLLLGRRRGFEWTSQEDLELLETLGEQAATAIENAMLHEETLEKQRMARELEVAQDIQSHLVPASDPETDGIEFSGSTVACHEIGGDFYDYVPLGERSIGIAIGDVSGKGIPAALLMAGLQSSFRTEAERGASPGPVLAALNHRILSLGETSRFVCFFYGVLDLAAHQLVYANAGLDPPVLVRKSGRVERLRRGGPILGVVADPSYPEGKVSLAAGDSLVLFTDGLTEPIENRTGLGEDALIRFIVDNRHRSAAELRARILDRLREFIGHVPADDTTLIVARSNR